MEEPVTAEEQFQPVEDDERMLKHLEFVQVAAIYGAVCFSTLYEFAKENAGPLRLGVENIEASVRTVLSPVYDKFHSVPFQLLKFVDRKVDDFFNEADIYVPSLVKQASSNAMAVATEVQRVGVADAARSVFDKIEPVAEQYAAAAWRLMNRLPLFPELAQVVVPTASYWSEKYNGAVCYAGERGYHVAEYLPLIPIQKIAEVFEDDRSGGPSGSTSTNGKMAVSY
ncbi:PREDICTED: REF/SRPP-like protein At2g47780 isoform X1 [Tarenaya hassleriana]|uniref:REF/SRPP-like protein At2g47780 isoform X1 n=1 Tax=Tarenaya hassleriana TaxID=28532 RepID=UPI00053C3CAC|nr:PREDICTED: REF/SRPP-like protein At2g47780 isoform X1 [Tarenaya hassleriana]